MCLLELFLHGRGRLKHCVTEVEKAFAGLAQILVNYHIVPGVIIINIETCLRYIDGVDSMETHFYVLKMCTDLLEQQYFHKKYI